MQIPQKYGILCVDFVNGGVYGIRDNPSDRAKGDAGLFL